MGAVLSTTIIAVTVTVSATVAVCLGHIGVGDYVALVGAFGGGAGVLHVTRAGTS